MVCVCFFHFKMKVEEENCMRINKRSRCSVNTPGDIHCNNKNALLDCFRCVCGCMRIRLNDSMSIARKKGNEREVKFDIK